MNEDFIGTLALDLGLDDWSADFLREIGDAMASKSTANAMLSIARRNKKTAFAVAATILYLHLLGGHGKPRNGVYVARNAMYAARFLGDAAGKHGYEWIARGSPSNMSGSIEHGNAKVDLIEAAWFPDAVRGRSLDFWIYDEMDDILVYDQLASVRNAPDCIGIVTGTHTNKAFLDLFGHVVAKKLEGDRRWNVRHFAAPAVEWKEDGRMVIDSDIRKQFRAANPYYAQDFRWEADHVGGKHFRMERLNQPEAVPA